MLQRMTYSPALKGIKRTAAGLPLLLIHRHAARLRLIVSKLPPGDGRFRRGSPVKAGGRRSTAIAEANKVPISQITHFAVRRHAHLV